MGYGILLVDTDWADEFDAVGFKLLNEEDNERYCKIKDLPEWKEWIINWSFGTNEGFEDDEFKGEDIEYKEIAKEEYETINKILKPYGGEYGMFPGDIFYEVSEFLDSLEEE